MKMYELKKFFNRRFGWYVGWFFGIGFLALPIWGLVYVINNPDAIWLDWVISLLLVAILCPLGCLIIRFVIEEYKHEDPLS